METQELLLVTPSSGKTFSAEASVSLAALFVVKGSVMITVHPTPFNIHQKHDDDVLAQTNMAPFIKNGLENLQGFIITFILLVIS